MPQEPGTARRWSVTAMVSALVSIGLAVFTLQQALQVADTETRVIVADFLNRFNSDDMWKARLTLVSYRNSLLRKGQTDIADATSPQLARYVYGAGDAPLPETAEGKDERDLFIEIDRGRRRIRNFYLDIMVFKCNSYFQSWLRRKLGGNDFIDGFFTQRFDPGAGKFLRDVWLPIEQAENTARRLRPDQEQRDIADANRRAVALVAWYESKMADDEQCKIVLGRSL